MVSIGKRETYAGVKSLVLTEQKKEEGGGTLYATLRREWYNAREIQGKTFY